MRTYGVEVLDRTTGKSRILSFNAASAAMAAAAARASGLTVGRVASLETTSTETSDIDLVLELQRRRRLVPWHWVFGSLMGFGAVIALACGQRPLSVGFLGLCVVGTIVLFARSRARSVYRRDYVLEPEVDSGYREFLAAFQNLRRAQGIWLVGNEVEVDNRKRNAGAGTAVQRNFVRFRLALPVGLRSNIVSPTIPTGHSELFLLPDRIIVVEGRALRSIEYQHVTCEPSTVRFIEEGPLPSDARQVDSTWRYTNAKGGPDRRFANNRELPIMEYGTIAIQSTTGLRVRYQVSSVNAAAEFALAFTTYASTIQQRGRPTPTVVPPPPRPIPAVGAPLPRVVATEGDGIRWYGKGTTFEAAGFLIRDANVYASAGKLGGDSYATDPSEILWNAQVRRPVGPVPDMGYWPWYSRISPEQRYQYLDWLENGKVVLPPADGHLFLYFYGIERRMLVDQLDKVWALREILRLRKLDEPRRGTAAGRSFRLYSSALLWFEVARSPEIFNDRAFATVCDLTDAWNGAIIAAPLSWVAWYRIPLSGDLAVRVARLNPRSVQSVVTKRMSEQFTELFRRRYCEKFGPGLLLTVPERPRRLTYRPASGGLEMAECRFGDPTGSPSQFEPLADLWNQCVEDLRGLSRVAAGIHDTQSVQAWEAMPVELQDRVDHPLAHAVQGVIANASHGDADESRGVTLVSAGALGRAIGIEQRPKMTISQSRRVADIVQHAGFAIEPDTRLTARAYSWGDRVAVFIPGDGTYTVRSQYSAAVCFLQLGLTIAEADGVIDPEELRRLSESIDAVFQLSVTELQRLDALRTVLLATGADLGSVSKRLESVLAPEERRQAGRLLVAIAAAGSKIDTREIAALRKCFRALALPPEQLDEIISQILPQSGTDLVTVSAGTPGASGEPIPAQQGLQLNREAISAILAETHEVATLLAKAMSDESEIGQPSSSMATEVITVEKVSSAPVSVPDMSVSDSTLPSRFAPFLLALRARPKWTRDEAGTVAREHRVMLDGAIEAINEWALERGQAPLIDDADGVLTVDIEPR